MVAEGYAANCRWRQGKQRSSKRVVRVMGDEIKWLIGLSSGVLVATGGIMVAAFNRLADRISRGDDVLHARINHVSEDYVRRVDLDGHLGRVDVHIRDLKAEMREQHRDTQTRLDSVLTAIKQNRSEKE